MCALLIAGEALVNMTKATDLVVLNILVEKIDSKQIFDALLYLREVLT